MDMFIASKFLGRLTAVSAALLLLAGCGKTAPAPADDPQVFDKAAPELKQMWQIALEASKTNDYVTAEMVLYRLSRPELTPEQRQAVKDVITQVQKQINAMANRGSADAQNAAGDLQKSLPK